VDESYRFLWIPSFDDPLSVRIERKGDKYRFRAAVLQNVMSSQQLPIVTKASEGNLTANDWARLKSAVGAADFWFVGKVATPSGLDGAGWYFEGRRGKTFTRFHRWSPDKGSSTFALGAAFISLSKIQAGKDGLY